MSAEEAHLLTQRALEAAEGHPSPVNLAVYEAALKQEREACEREGKKIRY